MSDFTLQKALEIQQEQLLEWKAVLNAKSYNYLVKKVNYENLKGYSDPYNVFRGTSMGNFVGTLAMDLVRGDMSRYDYLGHEKLVLSFQFEWTNEKYETEVVDVVLTNSEQGTDTKMTTPNTYYEIQGALSWLTANIVILKPFKNVE
jgi:hypothetical protein